MNRVAVILAAGSGSRTGFSTPKQFMQLGGKSVLEHSVQTFHDHPDIDEIVIVTSMDYMPMVMEMVPKNDWTKVVAILLGGKERYHSSLAAVACYHDSPDTIMLFHDAARPLIDSDTITRTIEAMQSHQAVCVAIPSTDTVVQCNPEGTFMTSIQDRNLLWRMQTPQAFRQKTISAAYKIALKDPTFTATDDCGTVLRYLPEVEVGIVRGNERNIKLTYADDLALLEFLLSRPV